MAASEERSISEFPSAVAILATTLLFVSTVNGNTYDSEKTTAAELATAILGDFEYTTDLDTSIKTIFGAINSIMVLSGTTVPSSAIGENGQLYVKYTSSGGTDMVDGLYWKINDAWVEISTGGGGGASVTLGTTVPSDASGSDGDLYVQYDGTSYAVIDYYVKINGSWRKSPYSRVVALTQAEYDLITPDNQTLYIITDEQSSYQTKQDANLQTTADTIVGAINELNGINTYSTIEKVIGKWTDNKTIYRKVLTDNFGNSMSLNIDSGVEIDTLVYISIKVIKGNIVFELPFRNEISASEYYQGYSFVNLQTSGNNALITIIGSSSNSTYFNNCDIQIVIEYTKR